MQGQRTDRRQLFGWTLLAGLVVFAAMCIPFFLGRVFTADDLGAFHLPIRDFYSRQLAAGEPWDWMPSLYCGFYLSGEGQLGGYHPLHLLLYRMLPLGAAFDLELLLTYPFMAAGMYLFLRRLVARRDAAAFGAIVFTFSSFNLLHFIHPNAVAVVAHVPWILWTIDLVTRSQHRRTVIYAECATALLIGSQLLLGYPQYVWLSLLCELSWTTFRLLGRTNWQRRGLELATAACLGFAIGGIQLLPTIDALATSTRQAADNQFYNSGSLHPLNLVQLVGPYLFATRVVGQNTHELGLYAGAVPLVLCAWLVLNRKRQDYVVWFLEAIALVALLYSLGQFGPLYRWQSYLPLVGSFRFPCRAVFIVQLAIAALSAIALVRISKTQAYTTRLWCLPIASVIVAAIGLLVWHPHTSNVLLVAAGPLILAVATALVVAAEQRRSWAIISLVLFAAADQATYGLTYAVLPQTSELNAFAGSVPLPPHPTTGRIAADLSGKDSSVRVGNRMLLAGFSRVDGYAGLEPAKHLDYFDPLTLRLAGVEWRRSGNALNDWERVSLPLPKLRFANGDGKIRTVRDRPGEIVVDTSVTAPQTMIVAESFHTGWAARLDGRVLPVVRADGDFLGCTVPPGDHRIEFRFEPASLRFGLLLTTCGLGLTMSWGFAGAVRCRKHPNERVSQCVHQ